MTPLTIASVVAALKRYYGPRPKPITSSAFEMILVENIAYLGSEEERRAALELLRETVGTRPDQLARASLKQLEKITSAGILPAQFAKKLQACGRIALEEFEGDLDAVLRLPTVAAKKALRLFPGIGEPGAEKILLFAGRQPFLAPESNGLRVLERTGLIPKGRSYAAAYAAAKPLAADLKSDPRALAVAHRLLRHHGQTLCKRTSPRCGACPLQLSCPSAPPSRP